MLGSDTRRQIIEVSDRLFHEKGFEVASFADIASSLNISRGNLYYHFKTKDEILDAVIAWRGAKIRGMLDIWEADDRDPRNRVRSFIRLLILNRATIMRHGCPVGTLCTELAKLDHGAQNSASGLFTLFRDWLSRQFSAAGRPGDADALAMHLLMRSQGIATLATALRDEAFLRREVADMEAWLDAQCTSS